MTASFRGKVGTYREDWEAELKTVARRFRWVSNNYRVWSQQTPYLAERNNSTGEPPLKS
jgi:hypothetical protein